jgi:hypothetical protein
VLLVDDEVRAALRLESAKTETDMSDLVAGYVAEHCAESLAEVRARREARGKQGKGKKGGGQ